MTVNPARFDSRGPPFWLGFGGCVVGAVAACLWFPGSVWRSLLPEVPGRFFLPTFASAFAAGWVCGLCGPRNDSRGTDGGAQSRASIAGLLTSLLVCVAAQRASGGLRGAGVTPLFAAGLLGFGLLPSMLFANLGAGLSHRVRERRSILGGTWGKQERAFAFAASAVLPAAAVLVWPTVYFADKLMAKAIVAALPAVLHSPPPKPEPPKPRYAKPEGFDAANAWKRTVAHVDVVDGIAGNSPVALSRAEDRVAFVARRGAKLVAVSRHLVDAEKDLEIEIANGLREMAWSPDDARVIALNDRGAFVVLDWKRREAIPLPIPKVDANAVVALVWWRDEAVAVTPREGPEQILSLDTLRMVPASKHAAWEKLAGEERLRIVRAAAVPPLHSGAKARYELRGSGAEHALVAHDAEASYSRVLASSLGDVQGVFSNRDGSVVFLAERERLRILYMGLRDAPTLRFAAESREGFPATDEAKAAIKDRAIECIITEPIANPLNGKTVAGDVAHAKGVARVIAAEGKAATIWVAEERRPIREGDVITLPRVASPNGGAPLSPTWFAVLTKADANQDIPRRESEKPSATTNDAAAAPTSAQVSPTTSKPDTPSSHPVYDELMKHKAEWMPKKEKNAPSAETKPPQPSSVPQTKSAKSTPPPNLSPEDKVRQLVVRHHEALSKHDLDGALDTCGAITTINGQDYTRDEVRATLTGIFSQKSRITEKVDGDIEVRRGQNNRFTASYDFVFEASIPQRDDERGYGHIEMDVLLTSQGPKMVKKTIRVSRVDKLRGK